MAEMSLTSSGAKKVLSFEEFTAAQDGGMSVPTIGEQPELPTKPIVAEPETPEMTDEIPATEPGQDEVTLLDGPEDGSEEPAPSGEETEEPTA